MFKQFIFLEWKSFLRSASFGTNLAMKIIMGLVALYFTAAFVLFGVGAFYILKEENLEPLSTVNSYMIYYLVLDLAIRFFLQKMPVTNIKPLLTLPIKRDTIVHFTLGKSAISFFNVIHAFFFIPFSIVLIINGYSVLNVLLWHFGIQKKIFLTSFLRFRKLIQQLFTHSATRNQRSNKTKSDNGCENNQHVFYRKNNGIGQCWSYHY